VRALVGNLFDWSAWAQSATELSGTTGEGAALVSIRCVGLDRVGLVVCGGPIGKGTCWLVYLGPVGLVARIAPIGKVSGWFSLVGWV
jgi:hypothetical protein